MEGLVSPMRCRPIYTALQGIDLASYCSSRQCVCYPYSIYDPLSVCLFPLCLPGPSFLLKSNTNQSTNLRTIQAKQLLRPVIYLFLTRFTFNVWSFLSSANFLFSGLSLTIPNTSPMFRYKSLRITLTVCLLV